jgi:cyclopropane fatty-acyl-phospholipid synthase-like methyltransferase
MGYLLASPLRRLIQNPAKIVAPYVREGMTVLEPGPGMGFFTLELARRVGDSGRVIAVDVQPRMLTVLERRASKAGLRRRIKTRLVGPGKMGLSDLAGKVDFALAFAMVHEMPDAGRFFRELSATLKPGALTLLVEPGGHVKDEAFDRELAEAAKAGLRAGDRPRVGRSHAAVLIKG